MTATVDHPTTSPARPAASSLRPVNARGEDVFLTAQGYTLTARQRDVVFTPPSEADENGVASPTARVDKVRARLSKLWYGDNIQKPTRAELEEAHHHTELEEAHDAPLEGHSADGHQFDGRHDVDTEHMSREH